MGTSDPKDYKDIGDIGVYFQYKLNGKEDELKRFLSSPAGTDARTLIDRYFGDASNFVKFINRSKIFKKIKHGRMQNGLVIREASKMVAEGIGGSNLQDSHSLEQELTCYLALENEKLQDQWDLEKSIAGEKSQIKPVKNKPLTEAEIEPSVGYHQQPVSDQIGKENLVIYLEPESSPETDEPPATVERGLNESEKAEFLTGIVIKLKQGVPVDSDDKDRAVAGWGNEIAFRLELAKTLITKN